MVLRPVPGGPAKNRLNPELDMSRPNSIARTARSCPMISSSGSTSAVVSNGKMAGSQVLCS